MTCYAPLLWSSISTKRMLKQLKKIDLIIKAFKIVLRNRWILKQF